MTISDINSFVSFRANTNTTDYSAANRLLSTNKWYQKTVSMILSAMDEWDWDDVNNTTYPVGTTSLVSGQRDYSFPDSFKILQVKRVDVTYDGSTWYQAQPVESSLLDMSLGDEATVDTKFQITEPKYDLKGNAVFLYPRPSDSTGSIRIEYLREPAEFTSAEVTTGTKEPGFDALFHPIIALGMCYDWFVAKGRMDQAELVQAEINDYEARLKQHYGDKDKSTNFQFTAINENYN